MLPIQLTEPWTPRNLTGLGLWLAADNLNTITKDGSNYVSVWNDQTNSGYSFIQFIGNRQPLWTDSLMGSKLKPAIIFDGVDDYLIMNSAPFNGNVGTIVFVATSSDVTKVNNLAVLASTDVASNVKWMSATIVSTGGVGKGAISYNTGGGSTTAIGDTTTQGANNIPMLVVIKSNGSAYTMNVNGVSQSIGGTNSGIWFNDISGKDNLIIGALIKSISNTYFKGRIAEIIYSSSELTSTEIDYCERYLNRKYGIY